MNNNKILISGAGIAGLCLAYWLKKYNFNPTIVEEAPALRRGGYMLDFWGSGFEVAEKMKIMEELKSHYYKIKELEFVDENGKHKAGFKIDNIRKVINYRHINILRSDLEKVIHSTIKNEVEIIFGNSIKSIREENYKVIVEFVNGEVEEYDLVVGADGQHSNVRNLIFGNESWFEHYLGYYTSSFTIDNYLNNSRMYQSYTTVDKQAALYSIADNKLAAFFVYRKNEKYSNHLDRKAQQSKLRETFFNAGWECNNILNKMPDAPDFYFDSVSQIEMESWFKNRIVLVGDACQCVTLLAGQGSSLAMTGAYVLAGELKNYKGEYFTAFNNYQRIMQPEIKLKQEMAKKFASSFVPNSSFQLWIRNVFTNLMDFSFISKEFVKKFMLDSLELKEY